MTWAMYHGQSENYASLAEEAIRQRNFDHAFDLYRLAAEQETIALSQLDSGKKRTIAITTVSAVSLWFKAHDFRQAQIIAHQGLAAGSLPTFAVNQLQGILQVIWNEEACAKAGVKFTKGEVLVSVSGGEIVTGGAPLEFILRKVDQVGCLFYRTIEMLLNRPLRRRGAPGPEIQEQFRPWLFQAPAGSYQFAVRVEKPRQLSLFPDTAAPDVELISQKFLEIVRVSADDPQGDLITVVPNEEYRDTFLKLTRNLAPTGKLFSRLEIKSSIDVGSEPIILTPTSRETIGHTLKELKQQQKPDEQKEIELRGILRGLQLDSDWIEIVVRGEQRPIRIFEAGDVIDDIVGPMVNRPVIINVIERPNRKYTYRDIQLEE